MHKDRMYYQYHKLDGINYCNGNYQQTGAIRCEARNTKSRGIPNFIHLFCLFATQNENGWLNFNIPCLRLRMRLQLGFVWQVSMSMARFESREMYSHGLAREICLFLPQAAAGQGAVRCLVMKALTSPYAMGFANPLLTAVAPVRG